MPKQNHRTSLIDNIREIDQTCQTNKSKEEKQEIKKITNSSNRERKIYLDNSEAPRSAALSGQVEGAPGLKLHGISLNQSHL